jgi:hypothetical protein
MEGELENSKARLSFFASVASAVRRQCGLEWTRQGYRVLARTRKARMERMVRAPRDVALHVVRQDVRAGTVVIEWEDAGRLRQAELPKVALARHARRRREDKGP